jgi:hypothetical protein
MNETPASNETKLGILNHHELNKQEAFALKQVWDYLIEHQEDPFDNLLVNKAYMGRLLTNYVLIKLGYPILNYSNRSENRGEYIQAMRNADNKSFEKLQVVFAIFGLF